MELMVRLLAPRSRLGFVVKSASLILAIVMAVIAAEAIEERGLSNVNFPTVVSIAVVVGSPFVVLILNGMAFQARLLDQLDVLANSDPLTGLPNRRAFLSRAQAVLDDGYALVLLDADNFKTVNDTYGHDVGDECLTEIAAHLKRESLDHEPMARMGGEEFAMLLVPQAPDELEARLNSLVGPVRYALPDGSKGQLTLSVGGIVARPGATLEYLLKAADMALFASKDAGRARATLADDVRPPQSGNFAA